MKTTPRPALRPTRSELEALVWRSFWTAIQTGTAVVVAAGLDWIDINVWQLAGTAAVGGVLSVVKNYASQKLGTGGV